MGELLVWLAVIVIVAIVAWWLINQIGLPEPAQKIITIVFVVVLAVLLISVLLGLTGVGGGGINLGIHR